LHAPPFALISITIITNQNGEILIFVCSVVFNASKVDPRDDLRFFASVFRLMLYAGRMIWYNREKRKRDQHDSE